jgi:ribose transport system ATP-binding protein
MPDARAALRLTNVWKSFVGVAALRGVSLEVRAGEVHALLGENGAGKSTLMAIAAGSLRADEGAVEIDGKPLTHAAPSEAQELGLSLVYQHPAVLEDLTVAENIALAVPAERRPGLGRVDAWAAEQLAAIDARLDVRARGSELSAPERQLVEIAKALALDPRVLILDEPTAALNAAEVERLFDRVRAIRERGTAVVYISHRIPEVVAIADRLTVLRTGETRGTFDVASVSEGEIVNLILGRELEAVFPDKRAARPDAPPLLELEGISGAAFDDVTLSVRAGEIFGFAGAEGNGQREALRALAGLEPSRGEVRCNGRPVRLDDPGRAQAAGCAIVPGDRQREGLLTSLSVAENAAASSLGDYTTGGFVRRGREHGVLAERLKSMAVKTPSLDTDVMTLSGGNQQKVVFARALLSDPTVLLCDEPTQGVDPGARVEIYRLLRSLADDGKAVIVLSSDAVELEGLCDRVAVFSRGHVIATLQGDDVTEEKITGTAISSTKARRETAAGVVEASGARRRRFLKGDLAPSAIVLFAILLLGAYTASRSSAYLTTINLQSALFLATALIFVSLGQLVVLLTGGIDLSVGPLTALTVVVLSFYISEGKGPGSMILGFVLVVAIGVGVGLVNGLLVRRARISPIIATLATFIALQGVAQLLRPDPGGVIQSAYISTMQKSVGFVPIVFIVAIVVAIGCELALRRTRLGVGLRAVGSDEPSAHRVGVRVTPTVLAGYVICSLLTVIAGLLLAAQVGIGDPTIGGAYTLSSVTAVVLGGASIYGGRGSFLGALLGAVLVTQIINAITFLSLGQAWQYWLPGALVLVAAALFARARGVRVAALAEGA